MHGLFLTLTTIWYSSGWGMRYPANTTFLSRCSCLRAGSHWDGIAGNRFSQTERGPLKWVLKKAR